MKCKSCNGILSFIDGVFVCDSCGSKTTLDNFFENIDVYICYIESDIDGRRTKDSIISQDIYQKLQSKKIDTFYGRVSADGLAGEDFEKLCFSALTKSKIIVVVGTSKDYFEKLYEKYNSFFENKIILPVFSDIDAGQIPKTISKIQALNYDTIGSDVTLVNSILNALGRKNEINQKDLFEKKGKGKLIAIILSCLILLIGVGCYIVFGTNLIINHNDPTESSSVSPDTRPDDYKKALAHIEKEEYSEAITILSKLSGYNDSDKQLQLIYDKYAGYYKSSDGSTTIHLIASTNNSAVIDVKWSSTNGKLEINETSFFTGNTAVFKFSGAQGTATLVLENEAITLKIDANDGDKELTVPKEKITFKLSEKSTKPISNIDAQTLLSWVNKSTTVEDLKALGYKINLDYYPTHSNLYCTYKIEDSDVVLNTFIGGDTITSIEAPARVAIPEYVGKSNSKIRIGKVFVFYGYCPVPSILIPGPNNGINPSKKITGESRVLLMSKASLEPMADDLRELGFYIEDMGLDDLDALLS